MKFAARIISIVFALLLIFFVTKPTFAQEANYQSTQNYQNFKNSTNPDVSQNLSTYTQSVVLELMGAFGCQLAGSNPITADHRCLGYDQTTGKVGYVNNTYGAIGFLGNMITVLYTPPIHSTDYINYLAGNFGIAKSAHAQYGVGMESLYPISGLFVTFRNITYFIFVIIFVFIGLGIMLRLRIDPRTVMTIQNQIPRVIIGIILITLSFAISGLMIDFMWVIMIAIINTLQQAHPQLATAIGNNPGLYNTTFSLSSVVGGFFDIATDTAGAIGTTFSSIFNANNVGSAITLPTGTAELGQVCSGFDLGCYVGSIVNGIGSAIGTVIGAVLGFIVGWAVGIIAWAVIIIALIVSLFKLWFALLKAYIMIIFDIIFAPFWIIAGLIPGAGSNVGFSAWLRDLASNLMAFPVVIGLFMLAKIIADGLTTNADFFMPPLIAGPEVNIGAIIAFGIIMTSPKVVDIVKAAFKASGPGLGMGSVGTGLAAVGAVGGVTKRKLYWRDSQNNTHGLGAELGRAFGRRAGSVTENNRFSQKANQFSPIRRARAKWTSMTNPEMAKMEPEDRATAYEGLKKGKSLGRQAVEAKEAAKVRTDAEAVQAKADAVTQRQQDHRELGDAVGGAVVDKLKQAGLVGGSDKNDGDSSTPPPDSTT